MSIPVVLPSDIADRVGGADFPISRAPTFQAACPVCAYFGPERPSNLAALRDYDAHARSKAHAIALVAAAKDADDADDADDPS